MNQSLCGAPPRTAVRARRSSGVPGRRGRALAPLLPSLLAATLLWAAGPVSAAGFSSVSGTVRGPQHRPVAAALVQLASSASGFVLTVSTNARGRFAFSTVPVGRYTLNVSHPGLSSATQVVSVLSGYAPVVDFVLAAAHRLQTVTVTAPRFVVPVSVTPTTLVSRVDIARTPGAILTNSETLITDFVPGAYMVHDMLHIRGGHQTSLEIDGVEIPNTSVASNLGPEIDPQDIQTLSVERGSYGADLGDRTYGIFNVVPRTGLGLHNEGNVDLTAGSYGQTDDYASFGNQSGPLAYFASVDGNRSDLGLETPTAHILHDAEHGYGVFGSVLCNPTPEDELRFVDSSRHDDYEIPILAGQTLSDVQRESDSFGIASWLHTVNAGTVVQSSVFYHYNSADYDGAANDFPISSTDRRASTYVGLQESLRWRSTRNSVSAGLYGFAQHDSHFFRLLFNDGSGPPISQTLSPAGDLEAAWLQDDFKATPWLTLSGGVRQTHFSGLVVENATDPRLGFTVQFPRLDWVLRGFWGKYYQAPPIETLSGPILAFVRSSSLAFQPLHGERDTEYQYGITIPLDGWEIDADHFRNRARNFFDHNPIGNSDVFFPITIAGALIEGNELTVRSPPDWRIGRFHLAYSNQTADGFGAITGGLQNFSPPAGYFALDHDQRNTLNAGFDADLPAHWFASIDLYYGSGFSNGAGGPSHLPSHYEIDLSAGRSFGSLTASVSALNLTDQHLLTDNSLTFGGLHYNNPLQIYAEVHYRFHY